VTACDRWGSSTAKKKARPAETLVNACILQRERELGELVPGAFADLLVVEGEPLQNLDLLQHQGRHIPAIMRGAYSVRTSSLVSPLPVRAWA
jgi:hypothetical protein